MRSFRHMQLLATLMSVNAPSYVAPRRAFPALQPSQTPPVWRTATDHEKIAAAEAKRQRRAAKRNKLNGKSAHTIIVDEVVS